MTSGSLSHCRVLVEWHLLYDCKGIICCTTKQAATQIRNSNIRDITSSMMSDSSRTAPHPRRKNFPSLGKNCSTVEKNFSCKENFFLARPAHTGTGTRNFSLKLKKSLAGRIFFPISFTLQFFCKE